MLFPSKYSCLDKSRRILSKHENNIDCYCWMGLMWGHHHILIKLYSTVDTQNNNIIIPDTGDNDQTWPDTITWSSSRLVLDSLKQIGDTYSSISEKMNDADCNSKTWQNNIMKHEMGKIIRHNIEIKCNVYYEKMS